MDFPSRKYPAHQPVVEIPGRSTIVFLTVCTKNRHPILSNELAHDLLRKVWEEADKWLVGRYVIMPDHVHLFCAPNSDFSVRSWADYWKTQVARRWPTRHGGELLQRDGWDTQMRSGQMYSEKWDYMLDNPVRAGLCPTPEEWQFQGELNRLEWHGP